MFHASHDLISCFDESIGMIPKNRKVLSKAVFFLKGFEGLEGIDMKK